MDVVPSYLCISMYICTYTTLINVLRFSPLSSFLAFTLFMWKLIKWNNRRESKLQEISNPETKQQWVVVRGVKEIYRVSKFCLVLCTPYGIIN